MSDATAAMATLRSAMADLATARQRYAVALAAAKGAALARCKDLPP
jgi:hypothetical protein